MSRPFQSGLLLITMLAMAGCAMTPENPGAADAEPVSRMLIPGADPLHLAWSECTGAGMLGHGPNDAPGIRVPPGWEDDWPINGLYYLMFECQRMAAGPFERGPVRGVVERYSSANPPEACLEGDFGRPSMLGNWWIDDAEIATHLAGLGMPARPAAITVETEGLPEQGTTTWRWQEEGQEESWVTFLRHGQVPGSIPLSERIFWFNGTVLGSMDWVEASEYHAGAPATGQLASPSVYTFPGSTTPFATFSGGTMSKLDLSASLSVYGDFECSPR